MEKENANKFSQSIADSVKGKTGFLIDVLTILQIIAALTQIYQLCNQNTEKILEDVDNMSLMNKALCKRVIKRYLPSANKIAREEVFNEIVFHVRQLKREEVNVILADFN